LEWGGADDESGKSRGGKLMEDRGEDELSETNCFDDAITKKKREIEWNLTQKMLQKNFGKNT